MSVQNKRNTKIGNVIARRRFILSSLAVATASFVAAPSLAKLGKISDRPEKLIVPFAAGRGVDVFARLIAERLRQKNGVTIVVKNRPGANGSIGGKAVNTVEADGATLLFSAGTHVMRNR